MTPRTEVFWSIIAYSICSATLVLLNKLTLRTLPYPSLVVCLQLAATLVFIGTANLAGFLSVDPIKWRLVVPYLYYTAAFAVGVYCNMKSLSLSDVETIVVFRAMCPCLVAVLDAMFLGREYPTRRSWFALALLVVGAYRYASYSENEAFHSQHYHAFLWPFLYLCIISFQMAYGKSLISHNPALMKTRSGPVLYTNLLGLVPMLLLATVGDEYSRFFAAGQEEEAGTTPPITAGVVFLLLLGCAAGTGIGYTSWWCREKVSATTFAVVGVINKAITILLNISPRDIKTPSVGLFSLLLCLIGGYLYRQAPLRSVATSRAFADAADEVWEEEISLREDDDEELSVLLLEGESDPGKRKR